MSVYNLISWTTPSEENKCLILVKGESGEDKLEVCEYNSDEDRYETEDKISDIDEINSVAIPPGFTN